MNYIASEISYPSSDGIHTSVCDIFTPAQGAPKGIVQLTHGMIDYVGRYTNLAEFLTGNGYILAGNNHLGHGKTAGSDEDLGFFGNDSCVDYLLSDMHKLNKYLRSNYEGLPIILLGHSMGSFLSRLYIEKYPRGIKGYIIHGTSGPNPLLWLGKSLSGITELFHGPRYRSDFLANLAFLGYNSKFDKSEGKNAWLTRDGEAVSGRDGDKYTNYVFTVSAYRDLFRFVGKCNSREWFAAYPKDLPTMIVSGDMDPVGNYGKGPDYVYKHLLIAGCKDVTLKLYPGARHELFNETNREEVFRDILSWIEKII